MGEPVFVYGIASNPEQAERAVEALVDASFEPAQISVVALRSETPRPVPVQHRTAIAQAASLGGGAGVLAGLVLAVSAPGLGLLASGPILAALQGAAGGGVLGSLLGVLAGIGYWDAEAEIPAQGLEGGGVLVGVHVAPERRAEVSALLERSGAQRVAASGGAH